jgi:autotransporter-associated beta strand protein
MLQQEEATAKMHPQDGRVARPRPNHQKPLNFSTQTYASLKSAMRGSIRVCRSGCVLSAFLLASASAAEVDITPIAAADGAFSQVTVGGGTAWQNTDTSRYLYGRRPNSFVFTAGQTLYVRVTYFDDVSGAVDLQYDAQTSNSKTSTLTTRTSRVNSGRFVDGFFELSDVRFNKSLNGADFRIVTSGTTTGAKVPVQRITLSDTPFANSDFQLAVSRAWKTRYSGPARDYVDRTTLKGKVMTGYQGWFGTPNDIADTDRWRHWAGGSMTSENFQIDAWPDLTEYDPATLIRAADVMTAGGAPAYLFSSRSYATVRKHFRWMRKHNIDGAWLQRFHPQAGAESEWVLRNVSQAAAEEGLIWGVEYDVSGMADATVAAKLQADWEWLTTQFDLLNDPRYVRENGKPVVFIWGLAVPDREFSTASANAAVDYFKARGAYVIGGLPTNWNTLNADWQAHMAKYDGVLVWQNKTPSDAALFRNRGQDFFPHIWAGFSWAHLKQLPALPLDQYTARSGGQFFWNKGRDWINASAGADRLFIGMFDEYDEATHVMPHTDDHPDPHTEWGRFIDNEGKPSDWWMMLTNELKRMMNGQRTNTGTLPTVASLNNRSNIGAEASVDLDTPDITASLSGVLQADGGTVVETVAGKKCRGNSDPATTHRYMYFNVNNSFAHQLTNGDVTVEVEYFDSFYGTASGTKLDLQYDSSSTIATNPAYTTHPLPITTTGSNTWRTVRFEISDAFFGGRQNGSSDFRLNFNGKKLNVNRVWVRLPENKAYPFTWTNAAAGPSLIWSQNANWLGGIVAQSDPTSIVRLFPKGTMPVGAISIQNDLNGQQFGTLELGGTAASTASSTVTLSGNAFSLGGDTPTITINALKTAHDLTYDIASPITLLGATQIGGPGNATLRISGALSGTGGLAKATTGTLVLSGYNNYSGTTLITGGDLTLEANHALPPTALTLGNATLNAVTYANTIGPLALTGNATISLGAGARLAFGNSSAMDWTNGTLALTGTFASGASIRFGTTHGGLTPAQLGKISVNGITSLVLNSSGYLTALPTGFPTWITSTFAGGHVPIDERGANDDPDNDGIPNLIEYAIAGQDPTVANPNTGTFTSTSLSYAKRPGSSGLAYAIQESTDVGLADTWAELPPSPSYTNNTGIISFTFTPGTPTKNFLRLQVISN